MSSFFDEQGRTRVFVEAYSAYSADGNPRRTLLIGKRAIYGWTLIRVLLALMALQGRSEPAGNERQTAKSFL